MAEHRELLANLCKECGIACGNIYIRCCDCFRKVHLRCSELPPYIIIALKNTSRQFSCKTCTPKLVEKGLYTLLLKTISEEILNPYHQNNLIKNNSGGNEVKDNSDSNQINNSGQNEIKDDSEDKHIKDNPGETEIKGDSEDNHIKDKSGENEIKDNSDYNQIKDNSGENEIKDDSENNQIKDNSEDNQIENNSGNNETTKNTQEDNLDSTTLIPSQSTPSDAKQDFTNQFPLHFRPSSPPSPQDTPNLPHRRAYPSLTFTPSPHGPHEMNQRGKYPSLSPLNGDNIEQNSPNDKRNRPICKFYKKKSVCK